MHRVGIRLSALLLLACVAIHAQCLAYCALGICPRPAETTHPPQCPHHPGNRDMPAPNAAHNCAPQEAFLLNSSPETASHPAIGIAAAPANDLPAPSAAAPKPRADAGPPLAASPPSPFVLRI